MASSLGKLTKGLGKDDFKNLDLIATHYTNEQQEMLKQKDGFDKLEEESLPPKSKFFSRFNNENISDAD